MPNMQWRDVCVRPRDVIEWFWSRDKLLRRMAGKVGKWERILGLYKMGSYEIGKLGTNCISGQSWRKELPAYTWEVCQLLLPIEIKNAIAVLYGAHERINGQRAKT